MNIKDVKLYMNKTVCYDTGQINIDGCKLKDFILTACILRNNKKNIFLSSGVERDK